MASLRPFRIIVKLIFGNHHTRQYKFSLPSLDWWKLVITLPMLKNFYVSIWNHTISNTWLAKKTTFGNWIPCPSHHASGFSHSLTFTRQKLKSCNSFFKVENIICSLKICYPKKSSSSKLVMCFIGAFTRLRWEYTCNNKGRIMFWSYFFIVPFATTSFLTNSHKTFMLLNRGPNMIITNMLWALVAKARNNLVPHPELEINQFQLKITLNERWIFILDFLQISIFMVVLKENENTRASNYSK